MTMSRKARNRALKLSAVGLYAAVAAMAACSSDPASPTTIAKAGASGAGAPATAGAPAVAGAPGAAGAPIVTAGAPGTAGADATAGAPAGGTGGMDTTTAGAPGAGAAGAPAPPKAFCDPTNATVQPRLPLPFVANTAFISSDYQNIGTALGNVACADNDRAPGAIGQCRKWSYTVPQDVAAPPAYVGVGYVRKFDAGFTHPPVCLADGATYVNFYAKGAVGGEKITVTAQGAPEIEVTLTTSWALYQIPLAGVVYNTDADGVDLGFFWKIIPATMGGVLPPETFQIDSIQWVNTGAVGTGGTGAGGGAGTGGGGTSAGGKGGAGGGGGKGGGGGTAGT